MLCYVDHLTPAVAARITALTPYYRVAYSSVGRSFHWLNFCEHCRAQLGDHETYCEPGPGFLAFTIEDARRITLSHVPEPFAASCGSYSIGVTLLEHMNREGVELAVLNPRSLLAQVLPVYDRKRLVPA